MEPKWPPGGKSPIVLVYELPAGQSDLMDSLLPLLQTVNPILILVMVPVVESVIYPLIAKCGLNFTYVSEFQKSTQR